MTVTDSNVSKRSGRRVTPGANQRFVAATEQLSLAGESASLRRRLAPARTTSRRGRVVAQLPDGGMTPFRCECGDGACTCAIRLTAAEYESVRAYAKHFAIARNHENPESDQLVEEHKRFAVVEMVSGAAAKVARKSDPRQCRGERSASQRTVEDSALARVGDESPRAPAGPSRARPVPNHPQTGDK
jgi:hypothetical protein